MPTAELFHATVLSNFARGFDKYARAYAKANIAESRYPDEFYVLRRDDLAIGARKAAALRDRLALPGDDLIALRAQLPGERLAPNTRNGLGLVWPSPTLPLAAVHALSSDGVLGPALAVEDVMARALRIHAARFAPYAALQPRSVSFLPIARGCQAACAFCFSEASISADPRPGRLDAAAIDRWLVAAARRGAERAVITGGGEPTLLRWPDLLALIRACRARLPKVVLISNGVVLVDDPAARLRDLAAAGLSVLAISRHHADEAINAQIMKLANHTPALAAVDRGGLRLRLICVLQRGAVDSVAAIDDYVRWAASIGADEVCFKELYVSTSLESVFHSRQSNAFSADHQVPLAHVLAWARGAGFVERARLPWGAPVFHGASAGRAIQVAAYTEPSLYWERAHGIARSWNVMADGACFASLEDRESQIELGAAA
ncbi:MAG TPA: radical SAM protein [Kofleriaceae bacterium]|nr:radical SAM protein [Kofleriaceae bacterium]